MDYANQATGKLAIVGGVDRWGYHFVAISTLVAVFRYWARLAMACTDEEVGDRLGYANLSVPRGTEKLTAGKLVEHAQAVLKKAADEAALDGMPAAKAGVMIGGFSKNPTVNADGTVAVAPTTITLWWEGSWTLGRKVEITVQFYEAYAASVTDTVDSLTIEWDSATDRPSTYLNVPQLVGEIGATGAGVEYDAAVPAA